MRIPLAPANKTNKNTKMSCNFLNQIGMVSIESGDIYVPKWWVDLRINLRINISCLETEHFWTEIKNSPYHPSLLSPSCSKGWHQSQFLRHFICQLWFDVILKWSNLSNRISTWTGPRIFFERSKDAVLIVIQLCYIVLWLSSQYKWAKIEEVVKMKLVWE